jgi:hypothetical protein
MSGLDSVIPAEVFDDSFFLILKEIAERQDLRTFLEIGSSSARQGSHHRHPGRELLHLERREEPQDFGT